jgi:hypothetical protein
VSFLVCSIGPVYALNYDQEGRTAGSDSVDGSYAQLVGNGFSAKSHECVVYATLTADQTHPHQIEAGVLRCNNATFDGGMCNDGHAYVEAFNGSSYTCKQGYTFTNNTAYDATTYRTSTTSTTLYGHINGASATQGGFGLNDATHATSLGEVIGTNTSCPAPSRGTFKVWQRYNASNGWHYVGGGSVKSSHYGIYDAPCWTASAVSATGGFDVD